MKNFLVHNEKTTQEMCEAIGISKVEDLFKQIPQSVRMPELNLPEGLSEMETQRKVKNLAKSNKSDFISFLGGGIYNKFVPACINQVASRFEFNTAYTPYQPEISQGTLQVMYEFQTMICRLTGMDISNATVYDAGTACAEAILMACRISKKYKVCVLNSLNPEYKRVIETYTNSQGIEVDWVDEIPQATKDYAGVLVQTPNYYGEIIQPKEVECLSIICCDPSSLAILKTPAEMGADIAVGDIQTLGIPMNFGGPSAGFIACREKLMRQLPGRLAGRTVDKDGKQAFCLTIQTREQHIKREKATSNICSNQALIGLCATLYLSVMGNKGFRQASYLSTKNAHILADKLKEKGYKILNTNFFNEFVLEVPNADDFLARLENNNILGGIKLDDKKILVATTEMISDEDIDLYIKSI
ncbi:MAG TPA: aminomethyl-transferring glycine dehydrogenase subunit GcvPA [Cyanobacteria bacterium UBA10660]|nr:MAG TPA: aminomethyl-transferring glycine dehydrogenase [Candidatus Gastranaerophilales bacterium HUM_1]HAS94722.1 aminomethyl-transferring glycine dehydrogenase subunit GcvPA [Cyanobacteria bacterium UBA10660]